MCFGTPGAAYEAIAKNPAVLEAPFIISKQEPMAPKLVTETALPSFLACWSSSPERAAGKRVAMTVTDKSSQQALLDHMIAANIPADALLSCVPPSLEQTTAAAFFAVASGNESAYNEPGFLASMRLQLKGTRTVVMTPSWQLLAWLGTEAAPWTGMSMQARLWHQLLNMQQEAIVKYTQSQHLVYGTFGPGDSAYVPPGWIVAESVAIADDCIGVRAVAPAPVVESHLQGSFLHLIRHGTCTVLDVGLRTSLIARQQHITSFFFRVLVLTVLVAETHTC
jgi:hypothetical protein